MKSEAEQIERFVSLVSFKQQLHHPKLQFVFQIMNPNNTNDTPQQTLIHNDMQ